MTMIDQAPAGYTAFAKSLCPNWCTEPHDVMTDNRDFPAVLHECTVGIVGVLEITQPPAPEPVEIIVQRFDNLACDRPSDGPTVRMVGYVEGSPMRPEDATQVALLLLRAAEIARLG